MLGLGLVVGIIALLLVGTFFGLLSYMAAMKTMTAKLVELRKVDDVKDAMDKLAALEKPEDARLEEPLLRERWRNVNTALEGYEKQLQETLQKGRDPDHGQKEMMYVQVLRAGLGKLDREITARITGVSSGTGAATALHEFSEIKGCIKELVLANGDLQQVIFEDLFKR